MKERPILLKSQEITAVLEGRKIQLRRILKAKQGGDCPAEMWVDQLALKDVIEWREQEDQWFGLMGYRTLALANCPFGKVGDRLWVRETFTQGYDMTHLVSEGDDENAVSLIYKADGKELYRECSEEVAEKWGNWENDTDDAVWKSPLHMPRWASRILLEITNVRIERLNEISEADCVKEGIGSAFLRDCKKPKFIEQWGQIHGPDTWSQNPWVWVMDFRVIEGGAV